MARMSAREAEQPGSLLRPRQPGETDDESESDSDRDASVRPCCCDSVRVLCGVAVCLSRSIPAAISDAVHAAIVRGPTRAAAGRSDDRTSAVQRDSEVRAGRCGRSAGTGAELPDVTVEGHYETHSKQSGQRETIWIATRTEQICQ